jgi:hypothetical protein
LFISLLQNQHLGMVLLRIRLGPADATASTTDVVPATSNIDSGDLVKKNIALQPAIERHLNDVLISRLLLWIKHDVQQV